MFDVMQSRWFYLSEKFLIGEHPETKRVILLVRNGELAPPEEVKRVLGLNSMSLDGPLVYEQGQIYYRLKEVARDDKAGGGSV